MFNLAMRRESFGMSFSAFLCRWRPAWPPFLKSVDIGFWYVPDSTARSFLSLAVWKSTRDTPNTNG
jgi:hypothetical protein